MEEVTQEVGSQTVESQQAQEDPVADAFAAFGLTAPQETQVEEPAIKEAPAIEQPEPKTKKVKHNKEEVEVDISTDEKLTDHLQRSLALDKERERKSEFERNLDRVAKLQGFRDHSELIANLDRIEQDRQTQQADEFEQLKQRIVDELVYNGVDEQAAREYADSNPLVAKAREALQQDQVKQEETAKAEQERVWQSKWQSLYEAYPHIVEDSTAWERGENPAFYTAEMQTRIARGYDPIDAFELAHKGSLQAQTKKAAEQKAIKDQMLGKRSQVETVPTPNNEPEVPEALRSAFSAFGLNPSEAKKYVKK